MKMSELESGYAEVNGTKLYYEVAGDGDPLVLIHGMCLDTRMWDHQFPEFSKNFKVIRCDLRGFGRSSDPKEGEVYSDHDDLKGLLDHLNISRAHVLGLSYGGGVVVNFTLEYPEYVLSLIPVDPTLAGYPYSGEFRKWWFSVMQAAKTSGLKEALDRFLEGEHFKAIFRNKEAIDEMKPIVYSHKGWSLLNQASQVNPDPVPASRLGEIVCPVLVVVGELDIPDFKGIADKIASEVQSGRKCVIKGVGHMSNIEDPKAFNEEVLSFLSSI